MKGILRESHSCLGLPLAPSPAPPQGTWGLSALDWNSGVKVVMDRRLQPLSPHRRFSWIDSSMNFTSWNGENVNKKTRKSKMQGSQEGICKGQVAVSQAHQEPSLAALCHFSGLFAKGKGNKAGAMLR